MKNNSFRGRGGDRGGHRGHRRHSSDSHRSDSQGSNKRTYLKERRNPNIVLPHMNRPLITFKTFMEMQRDAVDAADAQKVYDEYKKEYEQKHAEIFYETHGSDPWFIEKYDPEESHKLKKDLQAQAQNAALSFADTFLGSDRPLVCLDEQPGIDYINNDKAILDSPLFGFDANAMTLYLKQIPVHIGRKDILEKI